MSDTLDILGQFLFGHDLKGTRERIAKRKEDENLQRVLDGFFAPMQKANQDGGLSALQGAAPNSVPPNLLGTGVPQGVSPQMQNVLSNPIMRQLMELPQIRQQMGQAVVSDIMPKAPLPNIPVPKGAAIFDPNTKQPIFTNTETPEPKLETIYDAQGREIKAYVQPDGSYKPVGSAKAGPAPEKPPTLAEQFADAGGVAQAGTMPVKTPQGWSLAPVPGGDKDPAVVEAARKKELDEAKPKVEGALKQTVGDFDKTISVIDEILSPENKTGLGDVTGFGGTGVGKLLTLPGGAAARVQSRINQLKGRAFLSGLSAMKASSPTGATGLGATSEREGEAVTQAQAALDQAQSDEDYIAALEEYKRALMAAKDNLTNTFNQTFGNKPAGAAGDVNALLDKYAPR